MALAPFAKEQRQTEAEQLDEFSGMKDRKRSFTSLSTRRAEYNGTRQLRRILKPPKILNLGCESTVSDITGKPLKWDAIDDPEDGDLTELQQAELDSDGYASDNSANSGGAEQSEEEYVYDKSSSSDSESLGSLTEDDEDTEEIMEVDEEDDCIGEVLAFLDDTKGSAEKRAQKEVDDALEGGSAKKRIRRE